MTRNNEETLDIAPCAEGESLVTAVHDAYICVTLVPSIADVEALH